MERSLERGVIAAIPASIMYAIGALHGISPLSWGLIGMCAFIFVWGLIVGD